MVVVRGQEGGLSRAGNTSIVMRALCCRSYRSVVNPNAGFVKQLRDYSESLGIVQPPPKDDVERLEAKEAEKHAESAAEAAASAAAAAADSKEKTSEKVACSISTLKQPPHVVIVTDADADADAVAVVPAPAQGIEPAEPSCKAQRRERRGRGSGSAAVLGGAAVAKVAARSQQGQGVAQHALHF